MLKLVVFDMDGVLVDVRSSWQVIHQAFGASNRENLRLYSVGMISYRELMKRDIAIWGRVRVDSIRKILSAVPIMPGALVTCETLKRAGVKTALLSAGISFLAERLQKILLLDYVYANKVMTDPGGYLTGEGVEVVNLLDKTKALRSLIREAMVCLDECAAVGDSQNDIPVFRKAGLSIAFNSEDEVVRKAATVVVEEKDLTGILPFLI
jgi:phosphoserine phosphatase